MKKIILAIIIISFISPSIFCYLTNNKSCEAFVPDACDDETDSVADFTPNLGKLLIDGGNFFRMGFGDFQYFLGCLENSEVYNINYQDMSNYLKRTEDNIYTAIVIYTRIITYSRSAYSYNEYIINKLRQFDYDSYQKQHRLDYSIFKKVQYYLKHGNVIGAYEYFLSEISNIKRILLEIKRRVDEKKTPEIRKCWVLNQQFSNISLFSQYISEVFMNL